MTLNDPAAHQPEFRPDSPLVPAEMKSPGVKLAVDPGSVRVGIARSDEGARLAFPVMSARRGIDDLAALHSLVEESDVRDIYVGLPLSLSGGETSSTAAARDYAQILAVEFPEVTIRLVDERLTTVTAASSMQAAGKNSKAQRGIVDAAAAAVLLQFVLDSALARGLPIGDVVNPQAGVSDD